MTCKTIEGLSLCEAVADNYRRALPKARNGGTKWTIEFYAKYVSLRYQHISVPTNQEWKGADQRLKHVCEKHGEYETRPNLVTTKRNGCGCDGCGHENQKATKGSRLRSSTPAEKLKAKELYEIHQNYCKVGTLLGRPRQTIMQWLNPKYCKQHYERSVRKSKIDTASGKKQQQRREYLQTEQGKCNAKIHHAKRRLQKTNSPEEVFLDGQWHEVDMEATYNIWGEVLLPYDERQAINEIYKTCDLRTKRTGIEHHVDHIQPISKGGLHLAINLQVLTAEENQKKHNTYRIEDQALLASRYLNAS